MFLFLPQRIIGPRYLQFLHGLEDIRLLLAFGGTKLYIRRRTTSTWWHPIGFRIRVRILFMWGILYRDIVLRGDFNGHRRFRLLWSEEVGEKSDWTSFGLALVVVLFLLQVFAVAGIVGWTQAKAFTQYAHALWKSSWYILNEDPRNYEHQMMLQSSHLSKCLREIPFI